MRFHHHLCRVIGHPCGLRSTRSSSCSESENPRPSAQPRQGVSQEHFLKVLRQLKAGAFPARVGLRIGCGQFSNIEKCESCSEVCLFPGASIPSEGCRGCLKGSNPGERAFDDFAKA